MGAPVPQAVLGGVPEEPPGRRRAVSIVLAGVAAVSVVAFAPAAAPLDGPPAVPSSEGAAALGGPMAGETEQELPAACGEATVVLADGEELVERTLWFHGQGPVGNVDAAHDREEWRYQRLQMNTERPTGGTSRVLASNGMGGGNPALPFNFLSGYWHHALASPTRVVCAVATVYATTHTGELPLQLWVDEFHGFDVEKWTATAHAAAGEVAAYTASFGPLDVTARSQLLLEPATATPGAVVLYDSVQHPSALTLVIVEPPPPADPPDSPEPPDPPPCADDQGVSDLVRQDSWFVPAQAKLGNLAAVGLDEYPTWQASQPTGSVGDGAGGTYVVARHLDGHLGEHNPHTGATFRGTFSGCVDSLAVEMFVATPPGVTFFNGPSHVVRPRLLVDGVEVYRERSIVGPLLWTQPNPRDAHSRGFRLAFTGLDALMRARPDLFTDPDGTHTIELNLSPQFNSSDTTAYLYGTVEHPSSIIANLDAGTLQAEDYLMLQPNVASDD